MCILCVAVLGHVYVEADWLEYLEHECIYCV